MLTPRPEGLPSYSGKKPILVFGNIPNSTMGTEKWNKAEEETAWN